ncbi:MAG TPA: DUF4173 domain-containing protein [Actinomycetota bacterium]|nr:DUF4173 domain-containing protein [Actinomycetota bacterium]
MPFIDRLFSFEPQPRVVKRAWLIPLATAVVFDQLFWMRFPGLNVPLFVAVLLGGGYGFMRLQGLRPTKSTRWLALSLLLFSSASTARDEPLTLILDYFVVLVLAMLVADSASGKRWIDYGFREHVIAIVHVALAGIARGGVALLEPKETPGIEDGRDRWRVLLRGSLITLPILLLFGSLLASADAVFASFITKPLSWLDSATFAEHVIRAVVILMVTYVLFGVMLHAVRVRHDVGPPFAHGSADGRPARGVVEVAILLGSLNLLFGLFVGFQVRYFFGGPSGFRRLGLTYSQYARKGFGELLAVGVFVLLLMLALNVLVRTQTRGERLLVASMASGLVVWTGLILISAFQRLLLYEDAYGFTRLRTYSHVFMLWVGIALTAILVLQWARAPHRFALTLLIAGLGFTASLNILGVDAFVANKNIDRALQGAEFDADYLSGLSAEAIPVLISRRVELAPQDRDVVERGLVCDASRHRSHQIPWQSANHARLRAKRLLREFQARASAEVSC